MKGLDDRSNFLRFGNFSISLGNFANLFLEKTNSVAFVYCKSSLGISSKLKPSFTTIFMSFTAGFGLGGALVIWLILTYSL